MDKQLRLDKFLADMGLGTRSDIKTWIRKGRVKCNDNVCKSPEYKVYPEADIITLDDIRINYQEYVYYMLHKPEGVVSATEDKLSKTVLDLIPDKKGKGLFPIGRLDKDTVGLLLITNDGELAHRLLSPKKHVDKTYYAKVLGRVTKEDKEAFQRGVLLEGSNSKDNSFLTLPATLHIIKSDRISEIELTIQEGKFHQVKRMFEAVGKEVIYLKRTAMAGLLLDPLLPKGQCRLLTKEEIQYLYDITGINR